MVAAMRFLPDFRVNILEFIRFWRFEYFDPTGLKAVLEFWRHQIPEVVS